MDIAEPGKQSGVLERTRIQSRLRRKRPRDMIQNWSPAKVLRQIRAASVEQEQIEKRDCKRAIDVAVFDTQLDAHLGHSPPHGSRRYAGGKRMCDAVEVRMAEKLE